MLYIKEEQIRVITVNHRDVTATLLENRKCHIKVPEASHTRSDKLGNLKSLFNNNTGCMWKHQYHPKGCHFLT